MCVRLALSCGCAVLIGDSKRRDVKKDFFGCMYNVSDDYSISLHVSLWLITLKVYLDACSENYCFVILISFSLAQAINNLTGSRLNSRFYNLSILV